MRTNATSLARTDARAGGPGHARTALDRDDLLTIIVEALAAAGVVRAEALAQIRRVPVVAVAADEALAGRVRQMISAKRARFRYLPATLAGEPCWDMLCELFLAGLAGLTVSTTSCCHASRTPITTGLRWIAALEAGGLVERRPDPLDRRVIQVALSADGFARMEQYFREMPGLV